MKDPKVTGAVALAMVAGLVFLAVGWWRPGLPGSLESGGQVAGENLGALQQRVETAERGLAERPSPPLGEESRPSSSHRVFVSPLLLFFPDQAQEPVRPLDPTLQTEDGIRVGWKMEHGLDIEDPLVAGQDPDGDGFTNREEFEASTNPSDPKNTPAKWIKLRLQAFEPVQLQASFVAKTPDRISLRFRHASAVEDLNLAVGESFWVGVGPQGLKIFRKEAEAKTAVQTGEFPHPLPLRVKEYREDLGERFEPKTKTMNPYNDSFVLLERKDGLPGEIKILINDATRTQGAQEVSLGWTRLVPLVPGESPLGPFQPGQTFRYGGEDYLLLEASPKQAKLRVISADKEIAVLPATP